MTTKQAKSARFIIVGRGENHAKVAISTLTPEQQAAIAALRKMGRGR